MTAETAQCPSLPILSSLSVTEPDFVQDSDVHSYELHLQPLLLPRVAAQSSSGQGGASRITWRILGMFGFLVYLKLPSLLPARNIGIHLSSLDVQQPSYHHEDKRGTLSRKISEGILSLMTSWNFAPVLDFCNV